uniref:Cytochrome b n=1 Tax=Dipylidium caninum TaxID=66787 RepID=A0A7H9SQ49_DIPCN|nr:cytochrome b [Dipylidium caninum]
MFSIVRRNLIDLPLNYSLSYYWSIGFVISAFMFFQILTGILLSFLYVSSSDCSFFNVMFCSNDSFFCWCVRYWHIWGVNLLFVLFFLHMGFSLYYSSYRKVSVWNVGFILYLLLMGEAFTGYILPWHQMSYWAATVLTSIVDSVPVVGPIIYKYIVGGFSVTGVTLVRVFAVHVCLGFVMLAFMLLHLFYLHKVGTNTPLCISNPFSDLVFFHSYYTVKDFFLFIFVCFCVCFFLFCSPDFLIDVEAYFEADPLNTPLSIKPEWYFLPFYAILRCIGSKLGGLFTVISFLFFSWVPTKSLSSVYFIGRQLVFWLVVGLFFSLVYLGGCHPEYPYLTICQVFSFFMVAFMFYFKLSNCDCVYVF